MRLFFSLNPLNIQKQSLEISPEYAVEIWYPAWNKVCPHYRSIAKSFIFWILDRIGIFPPKSYGGLRLYHNQQLIHTSLFFPKFFRFPFMGKLDTQVGDVWTSPKYRNKGIAGAVLQTLSSKVLKNASTIWYVTSRDNVESQKVARKSGFKLQGMGEKTAKSIFSQHVIRIKIPEFETPQTILDEARATIDAELKHFEGIYSAGAHFSSEFLRSKLLQESEKKFLTLLQTLSPNMTAIEIGSGFGHHSITAAQSGANVLGVDISPSAVEISKNNSQKNSLQDVCRFVAGDVAKILEETPQKYSMIIDHESLASFNLPILMGSIVKGISTSGVFLGVESLSNNPVFKLNRWIGYRKGRRTLSEFVNAFTDNELNVFKFCFERTSVYYFHLIAPFCSFIRKFPPSLSDPLGELVSIIDTLLLKIPFLRSLAFKCVIVADTPKKPIYDLIHSNDDSVRDEISSRVA